MKVSNNYDVALNFSAQFKGIDETANIIVPAGDLDGQLAGLLKVSETNFTVPARSSRSLTVQASDAPDLRAGGHYATLQLTPDAPTGNSTVRAALSVSLFITKQTAGVTRSLQVDDVQTSRWPFRVASGLTLRMRNDGNIHGVPRASVRMLDKSGDVIAQGVANPQSMVLLPGRSAAMPVALQALPSGVTWLPQRLQLDVIYRYDGEEQTRHTTKSMWLIPPMFIIILAGLLIAGGLSYGRLKQWKKPTKKLKDER